MKHLMVDIETMGLKSDAPICSIGAASFDPFDPGAVFETFELTVSLTSNAELNRTADLGTVTWWLQQKPEAQAALLGGEQFKLSFALEKLRAWIVAESPTKIWANSPSFDLVILRNAMETAGLRTPWRYFDELDVRTCKFLLDSQGIAPPNIPTGIKHKALDDVLTQITLVQTAMQLLR